MRPEDRFEEEEMEEEVVSRPWNLREAVCEALKAMCEPEMLPFLFGHVEWWRYFDQ